MEKHLLLESDKDEQKEPLAKLAVVMWLIVILNTLLMISSFYSLALTCKKLEGRSNTMLLTIIFICLGTIYRELYTLFYLMVEVYSWISEFNDTVVYGFFVLDNTFYLLAFILTIWKW
jgi:ABC-type protease/lipase transport system fused ATPase/permease subunit